MIALKLKFKLQINNNEKIDAISPLKLKITKLNQ